MNENGTRQRKQNDQEGQKWDTTIDLETTIYGDKATENYNKNVHICRYQFQSYGVEKRLLIYGNMKQLKRNKMGKTRQLK